MFFPIRHATHNLEQKSEAFLRNHIPNEWVINRPQNDYGIDFQLSITEDGQLRGLELVIQLKASKNSSGNKNTESFQLKTSTYNYLRKILTVVMFVKYVESENEAYWELLRNIDPPADENQKTFTAHIPKEKRLSAINWNETAAIVRQITDLKWGAVNG
jgi:hypothetical protein